jgi:hypothetical protein
MKFVVSLHVAFLQRGAPYKNFEDHIDDLDRSFADIHKRTKYIVKQRAKFGLKPGEGMQSPLSALQVLMFSLTCTPVLSNG